MSHEPDALARVRALTRTPTADLVAAPAPTIGGRMLAWWTPRRVLVMAVLWPAVGYGLWLSSGASLPLWLIAAVAGAMAVSFTSFTPLPGQSLREVLVSPCSSVGGILPMLCAWSLLTRPGPNVVLALFLIGFGLTQRLSGGGACGVPGGSAQR